MKCCGPVKQDKRVINHAREVLDAVSNNQSAQPNSRQDSPVAPYRTRVRTAFGYTTVV